MAKFLKLAIFDTEVTHFLEDFTLKIIDERNKSKNKEKRVDFLQLMLDVIENINFDDSDENQNYEKISVLSNKSESTFKNFDLNDYFIITHY